MRKIVQCVTEKWMDSSSLSLSLSLKKKVLLNFDMLISKIVSKLSFCNVWCRLVPGFSHSPIPRYNIKFCENWSGAGIDRNLWFLQQHLEIGMSWDFFPVFFFNQAFFHIHSWRIHPLFETKCGQLLQTFKVLPSLTLGINFYFQEDI